MAADSVLDVKAYTEGDQFQRERRNLFGRNWLAFCATSQLRGAGAFVSHTIGGWPLFVQRGTDDALRAFHNVCRHQGMPVIEKPTGTCEQLRCRYHGWTYDLTGALIAAPPMVAPADMSAQHLNGVSLTVAGGLLFVAVKPAGPAPEPLAAAAGELASSVSTDAFCNWKTLAEALLLDGSWEFHWPNVFTRQIGGGQLVRQVVPRSFNRTRFFDLMFGGMGGDAAGALASADKARAEALQEQRAAGTLDPDNPALAGFRTRVVTAAGS